MDSLKILLEFQEAAKQSVESPDFPSILTYLFGKLVVVFRMEKSLVSTIQPTQLMEILDFISLDLPHQRAARRETKTASSSRGASSLSVSG